MSERYNKVIIEQAKNTQGLLHIKVNHQNHAIKPFLTDAYLAKHISNQPSEFKLESQLSRLVNLGFRNQGKSYPTKRIGSFNQLPIKTVEEELTTISKLTPNDCHNHQICKLPAEYL